MKADKRKVKKYGIGGPTSYSGEDDSDKGMKMSTRRGGDKESSKGMSDEERYGKVGAAIRRLDPEAFKNRTDKSAAANLKLLKELRERGSSASESKPAARAASTSTRQATAADLPGMKDVASPKLTRDIQKLDLSKEPKPAPAAAPAASRYAGPRFGEGVDQLRNFLKRDAEEKAARNRGMAERFGEFVRNTRMVGGAPEHMKDESGRIRIPSRDEGMRRGGKVVKKYASGGSVGSSASKRADGIAARGKTRCKIV